MARTTINKIRQGDQPTLTCAANFRLIASDIPWDEQAVMRQFRSNLHSDVKDLLLTLPKIQNHLQKLLVEQYSVIIAFLSVDERVNK